MKKLIKIIKRVVKKPANIFTYMNRCGMLRFLPDKYYVKLMYWVVSGKKLDLNNPKGFNEKLQWLKLYDRREEYTIMVDKYKVRSFVEQKIGSDYLIPLIDVWDNIEDIDFQKLPDKFVLKCNHNTGKGMYLCKDRSQMNIDKVKSELKKGLKENLYMTEREWPYKNVEKKIICEEFMIDYNPENNQGTLIDFKFYCFNGEPKFLYVEVDDISTGKKGEAKLSFFDMNMNPAVFYREDHAPLPMDIRKPECFNEMVEVAKKLSEGIPFVRVDLYWANNKVLFSELTFFPGGGYGFFSPEEWENKIGDLLELPQR